MILFLKKEKKTLRVIFYEKGIKLLHNLIFPCLFEFAANMSNSTSLSFNSTGYCGSQQYSIKGDIGTTARNLKYLLPLLYVLPSVVLNLRIIALLFKERNSNEFSSYFYRLFMIASITVSFYYIYTISR